MGYCGATEYVDQAVAMADAAVETVLRLTGGPVLLDRDWAQVDDAMREHLRVIVARALEDDWDCQPDSRYFNRFRDVIDPDGQFTQFGRDDGEVTRGR